MRKGRHWKTKSQLGTQSSNNTLVNGQSSFLQLVYALEVLLIKRSLAESDFKVDQLR